MKPGRILFFIFLFVPLFYFAPEILALDYGGGTYTNLCGTGAAATENKCNRGCNTNTGTCSSSGSNVAKFTCDRRLSECRGNESNFSTSYSVAGTSCGKTVQIDVYNKTCRIGGNWVCNEDDLLDYMVWYSGDCQAAPVCSTITLVDESGQNFTNWRPGVTINWYATSSDGLTNVSASTGGLTNRERSPFVTNTYHWNYQATVGNSPGTYTLTFRGNKGSQLCTAVRQFTISQAATPTKTPTAPPTASPTPRHVSSCDRLTVVSGNNTTVPATVVLRASGSDNKGSMQAYRFFYGDGKFEETVNQDVTHRYEASGTFLARAEVRDSSGAWKSSSVCEATVTVQSVPIETHKSDCSDLFITEGNYTQAPTTAKFTVSGYDNKGAIKLYKMDFDVGISEEKTNNRFERRYSQSGTYTVRGYIQDSRDNWKGGSGTCEKSLYINTAPLTKQPATGAPTAFTIVALTGGVWASSILFVKRYILETV